MNKDRHSKPKIISLITWDDTLPVDLTPESCYVRVSLQKSIPESSNFHPLDGPFLGETTQGKDIGHFFPFRNATGN